MKVFPFEMVTKSARFTPPCGAQKGGFWPPPPLPFPAVAVWSPGPEAFLSLDPKKNAGSG